MGLGVAAGISALVLGIFIAVLSGLFWLASALIPIWFPAGGAGLATFTDGIAAAAAASAACYLSAAGGG